MSEAAYGDGQDPRQDRRLEDDAMDTPHAYAPSTLRDVGEDDDGVYVIAVGETGDPESWQLALMECDEEAAEDPQEIALGCDTYCLVVDPGQATHYGGVLECEVAGTRLRLSLTSEAAAALALPADVSFGLSLTADQVALLKRGLARVLSSGRTNARPVLLQI
ncbi:Imm10 family immunity protein [Micromonospora robiginosa]|uniref:Imm10 family immunity protein n=1 Tax=Micromonospora robiginosa TaxID=2749844 RepID=A0A7L6B6J1_9ACTN|nr:Imm10 family immunity protein [Micromonospora ferruginea]QLQ37220.1 Imm10 family immunity protein [Micromonospora ferruginea]